jgi:hypothetical protein
VTAILACRDKKRGEAARHEIIYATGNSAVELLLVDVASQESIRHIVAAFSDKYDRLDEDSTMRRKDVRL